MRSIILLFMLFISYHGMAQVDSTACACCTPEHRLFDFWVGDWTVYDTSGTVMGENLIQVLEDGCILNERWVGSQGSTGRSYNYYHRADSTWNQLWIDNSGNPLILKGTGSPGQMILQSELIPGQRIDLYRNRITWTLQEDGTVTQVWDILDKTDNVLQTVFYGIYRKKKR
ncbi:MAG: hypothetical protein HKN79_05305 [Flavobacteriales bacterium]|nr:hypothetical protein [Flavobacteriales bacterium]